MTAKIPNSAPLLANGRFSQEWTRFLLNVSSGGGGTVTTVSVTPANGVSGTVTNPATTPAISLALGNITPTQIVCSGPVSGTNLSGTNSGDQTISISGDVTAAGSTGVLSATVTKINGTSLAGLATGILKNTTTTGVPSIAAAGSDYLTPPAGTSILKANSGGALANAVAGTDYLAPPAGTAILKANSGGALANAVAGTDYLAPPAGTSILKGNSGGALANATAGTDYVAPGGALGTPSSGTLTNCTGLPISTGVSGLGTGVATFLATPSSANLASAMTDETGTGVLVFGTAPTISNGRFTTTVFISVTAPASISAAATLTAAQLLAGLIQYTGAAAALTFPTGTNMDAAITSPALNTDQGFEFCVINTGSGAATMTAGTGFTIVGSATVTNGTSARYRCRKSAANTFIAYRVS